MVLEAILGFFNNHLYGIPVEFPDKEHKIKAMSILIKNGGYYSNSSLGRYMASVSERQLKLLDEAGIPYKVVDKKIE